MNGSVETDSGRLKGWPASLRASQIGALELASLGFVVSGSAMALGGQHVPILCLLGAVAFAAAASILSKQRSRVRLPLIFWGCAALALYTYCQALPLPLSLLSRLSPNSAAVWSLALRPLHEDAPTFATLTLDPGATLLEGLKWTLYAALALTATLLGRAGKAPMIIAIVFCSGMAIAAVTVLHGLVGATTVFGFYTPDYPRSPWHMGPLLNPNNLASYLNLGVFCGLGLLSSRRSPIPAFITGLGSALLVASTLLTASRAGVASLVVGLLVIGIATFAKKQDPEEGRTVHQRRVWMLWAICGGLMLALLAFQASLWSELIARDLGKLAMIAWVKPMLLEYPWFGIGRGAFESTFPAYHSAPDGITWSHAENFPAQWLSEWGIPVGLLALIGLASQLRPRLVGLGRSNLAFAPWLGLLVVLLQNLADLGLELAALSCAFFCVLGALLGDQEARSRRREPEPTEKPRTWLAQALAVFGALSVVLAALLSRHTIRADKKLLQALSSSTNFSTVAGVQAFRAELRDAIARHPAEPFFPLLGGALALSLRDDSIPWLNRALERSKSSGKTHLLLARALARRGAKRQSLLELRLAVQNDHSLARAAAHVAVTQVPNGDGVTDAVPPGRDGAAMLVEVAALLPQESSTRRALLKQSIARDPDDPTPRIHVVQDTLAEFRRSGVAATLDAKGSEVRDVEKQLEVIRGLIPARSDPDRLYADLLFLLGHPEESERILAARCAQVTDHLTCLSARVSAAARIRDPAPLTQAERDLASASCAAPEDCLKTSLWLAELHEGRHEPGLALNQYLKACELEPMVAAHWLRAARAALLAGLSDRARDALEHAYRLGAPHDASLDEQLGHAQVLPSVSH